ncbi:transmembrane protein 238-like [Pseudoliparis swirei]|uniref:transmembrane protein 238-like n=1 Tax=Pseudoliparis swirei TaxID=2059687 RepID=UPI0024BE1B85|nr:transmembrane protein 238-like [Pseudoliparis swirei]
MDPDPVDMDPDPVHRDPVHRGLGRCACCFWLAVAFDVVGLLVLLTGVFARVFFYDLLIYAGAIVVFLSLIWWVFWYSGNIEVRPADLEDDVGLQKKGRGGGGLGAAVRRLSSRVAGGLRTSLRRTGTGTGGGPPGGPRAGQVAVSMATMTPQGDDVETPHTTTETSPT